MNDDLPPSDVDRLLEDAKPPMPGPPSGTLLEQWIEYTCIQAMSAAQKDTERVAAAKVAVAFLAVKLKIPVAYGSGFTDE